MPPTPFCCPRCGKELPLGDLNVSADMALCRACGFSGAFLQVASVPLISDEEMARPPKRVKLRKGFDDALNIICRPKRTPLWFLLPFTALWSGVSISGIYGSQLIKGEFDLTQSLFGLPFLIGTIVLVGFILLTAFGTMTITLTRGYIRIFYGVFGLGRTQEMGCEKGTTVSIEMSNIQVNRKSQPHIVLRSGEQKLKFGALSLSAETRTFVAAVLRRAGSGG